LETAVKKLYEAMFLVDSEQLPDWDTVAKTVKKILKRSDAEIVSIRNWAERKLAYEINKRTRGTYVLCYFRAEGDKIRNIEKDVQLSEQIMRVLILSAETRKKEEVEKDILGPQAEKGKPKIDQEAAQEVPKRQKKAAGNPELSPQQESEQADETEKLVGSIQATRQRRGAFAQTSEVRLGRTPEPEQTEQSETEKDSGID
jgi:small subunit ribosomal protein S6